MRRSEVEFFLRLHGLREGVVASPSPPEPPLRIEPMEPIEAPPRAIWAMDATSFWTPPIRALRRNGRWSSGVN